MPRLNIVDPASDTGAGADLLNGPLKSKQINIFKGMATNAGVLKAFLSFAGGVKAGALTDAEHEIVALATSQKRHCEYCLAAHTQIAKGAGIAEDLALKIRQGQVEDPKQQALIDFVHAVIETDGFVTGEQLEAVRGAGYDDAAIIEVLAEITVMTFTNLFNHVNETEIDFPVPAAV